jgi:ribonuclease III
LEIQDLQQIIKINFNDLSLLKQALVHSSFVNELADESLSDNERLEFLGDAILNFTSAELIYHRFPNLPEGKMTEMRVYLIREETLAQIAQELNLGIFLFLGKGEEGSGGRKKQSSMANAFEALLGAIFLDQGIETVRKFITERLEPFLKERVNAQLAKNYKGKLQEYAQSEFKKLPFYRLSGVTGPDHDRNFTVEVSLTDKVLGVGTGKNKKAAEMEAARITCERLGI